MTGAALQAECRRRAALAAQQAPLTDEDKHRLRELFRPPTQARRSA